MKYLILKIGKRLLLRLDLSGSGKWWNQNLQRFPSCKKCFDCPRCFSSLSFHSNSEAALATPISPRLTVASVETPTTPKEDDSQDKIVYLRCGFCQWDSLTIGLKASNTNDLICKPTS
jgi:hypothetical protein